MRRSILILTAIVLALGAIEGLAYWWMNPKPAGLGEPVLVYRPGDRGQETGSQESEVGDQDSEVGALASSSSSRPSTFDLQTLDSPSSITLLPEVVAAALPSLRCSTGTAARIDREDGATIHLAFFEWDLADSTNVLEAFKHLPDECMGSIGMTLIEKKPPRTYVVGSRGTGDGGQELEVGDQESEVGSQSYSSPNIEPPISNHSSPNPQSPIPNPHLLFDHTVFRDPAGVIVHAFKGVWVSGASKLLGDGLRGGGEQWRQVRWKAGLKRFRPAYARVAQGAVRGIANPDVAWEVFEEAMLKNLRFE